MFCQLTYINYIHVVVQLTRFIIIMCHVICNTSPCRTAWSLPPVLPFQHPCVQRLVHRRTEWKCSNCGGMTLPFDAETKINCYVCLWNVTQAHQYVSALPELAGYIQVIVFNNGVLLNWPFVFCVKLTYLSFLKNRVKWHYRVHVWHYLAFVKPFKKPSWHTNTLKINSTA